jgi:hypothetical protein
MASVGKSYVRRDSLFATRSAFTARVDPCTVSERLSRGASAEPQEGLGMFQEPLLAVARPRPFFMRRRFLRSFLPMMLLAVAGLIVLLVSYEM